VEEEMDFSLPISLRVLRREHAAKA